MRGLSYPELAVRVLTPFLGGEIGPDIFERLVREAYGTFRHEAVCPLVQIGSEPFMLELFHGPTLAFKDVAMQFLARLMDHVLAERGQRATIVGATSGDTGGAAIDAFAGRDRTDIFILFPHGRVSPVQQRQMTTSAAANVHALAIEGNFDDCQALVKDMFNDHAFRDRVSLSGVNSINWARIMAQIVYYLLVGDLAGQPGPPGLVHRADRQFRRHLRRLRRQAHGPADRAAGHRHQRQRHPGAHAGDGRVPDARGRGDDLAVDGHPGVVEFRAAAVRGTRRDADAVRREMGGLKQSGAFTIEAGPLDAHPRDVRRRPLDQRGNGGYHQGDVAAERLPARPAHRDRHSCGAVEGR